MTCIKICGITNIEDALKVSELGADALGFVFYDKSSRYINPQAANDIIKKLPPFITPVALFVNATEREVNNVIAGNHRWNIQFHGDETDAYCCSFGRTFIKALRVKKESDIEKELIQYPSASAILLDAFKQGVPGGTGECFDWGLIPQNTVKPIILAGGLTPDNVKMAIKSVAPYAVDVSGGVEKTKGIKDYNKLISFFNGARN